MHDIHVYVIGSVHGLFLKCVRLGRFCFVFQSDTVVSSINCCEVTFGIDDPDFIAKEMCGTLATLMGCSGKLVVLVRD